MSEEYRVYSFDAFVAPCERSDMLRGEFDNLEDAENFARKLIDDEVADAISRGKSLEEAIDEFKNFGEIPMVIGSDFQPYEYVNGLLARRINGQN